MNKRFIGLLISLPFILSSCSISSKEEKVEFNHGDTMAVLSNLDDEAYTLCLEINTANVKKVYEINEELDLSGLVVNKRLSNGENIIISDYEILDVDLSSPGYKNVVIRYETFYASFSITVKGFVYRNYDEKYVYFLNETFNRDYFSLIKYDEIGAHEITDYNVSFPDNTVVGLGQIIIAYEDFRYVSNIAILEKQDNVPAIFSSTSNNKLLMFSHNIHADTFKGEKCTVSEGYYLLVKEDGTLELFDYKYMLYGPLNASYFGSTGEDIIQRLIPGGDLLVTIHGENFIIDASIWHHTVIGW